MITGSAITAQGALIKIAATPGGIQPAAVRNSSLRSPFAGARHPTGPPGPSETPAAIGPKASHGSPPLIAGATTGGSRERFTMYGR